MCLVLYFQHLVYLLHHLIYFNSTRTVFNLPTSKSPTFIFKLFKVVETLANLAKSNFPTKLF